MQGMCASNQTEVERTEASRKSNNMDSTLTLKSQNRYIFWTELHLVILGGE